MKNILVVGGGVVGITAAYFAKKNIDGSKVSLIEANNNLGGLLKSDCNKHGCFDYGTHVASKTGVEELDTFLFSNFTAQNSYKYNTGRSGNFFNEKLSDISPYVNTSFLNSSIYEKGCEELLEGNNKIGINLKETLVNRYGETFYSHIFKNLIFKFFGCDPKLLANECLYYFDMNRLLAFDKETTIIKKKNSAMDSKLGFHSATSGVDKVYPKHGGIGAWIKHLEQKLIDNDININTKTQITDIKIKNNKIYARINNDIFEYDQLVWTLSSGLLNQFLPTGLVGSKPNFRKTGIYDFVFDLPLNTKSYYINVYDEKLISTRITCYQNLKKDNNFYACSIEVLQDKEFAFEQAISKIQTELSSMGLIQKGSQCSFSQCRILKEGFPILTNSDVVNLTKINQYYQKQYENISLLGRSSANGFFMSELLISAYQQMLR